jgi:GT2 family glycosyltransferase
MSIDIRVVIPCRNGAGTLGKQIEALLIQGTEAVFEIVVDSGSTDGTTCGGRDRFLDGGENLSRERKLYRPLAGGPAFANGANCGFTAEAFHRFGGFDEAFAGGADKSEFFSRLAGAG